MNASNWRHVGYSLLIMLLTLLVSWPLLTILFVMLGVVQGAHVLALLISVWSGAAAGGFWMVSREHAQREVDLARADKVPVQELYWWEGFTGWDKDRWLDCVPSCVVNALVASGFCAWVLW